MKTFSFTPADAWFFRDSRPYNEGEFSQSGVNSIFPPHAPTVVGALRAALARSNGWTGRYDWPDGVKDVLGDGFEDLGTVEFFGPYLADMRDEELLVPAPLHLLGAPTGDEKAPWEPRTMLTPGEPVQCDLGDEVRLPVPVDDEEGLKEPRNLWLSAEGWKAVLRGKAPSRKHLRANNELWSLERRVGLVRDDQNKTTEEGALYSPGYVRLNKDVALSMAADGIPEDWEIPTRYILGGESRMAIADIRDEAFELPDAPVEAIVDSGKVTVTFITPALFEQAVVEQDLVPGKLLGEWNVGALKDAELVSACVGKPVYIGGWNSLKNKPMRLRAYLPPGSTWFVDVEGFSRDRRRQLVDNLHGEKLGGRTAYGHGQVLLGTWPA